MARASRSVAKHARHKKWLKRAKGYRGRRHTTFKIAKEAVLKAGTHAYFDRRKKKSNFRAAWQVQINAAARQHGLTYSKLISQLRQHKIGLDRKILAQLALNNPKIFQTIVEKVSK